MIPQNWEIALKQLIFLALKNLRIIKLSHAT